MAARIVVPPSVKRGEVFEIKTLVQHPMETGYRRDAVGAPILRHIIETLVVTHNGEEIFRSVMTQGIAANPYIAFFTTVTETGEMVFTWTDEKGLAETQKVAIKVA